MAKILGMKEWKKLTLDVFSYSYKGWAEKWADKHDDRIIVHNLYNMIVDAISKLPDDDLPNYIRVAINHSMREDEALMDEIINKFKGRDD